MNRCLLTVFLAAFAIVLASAPRSEAQTTEFNYQGNLQTSSVPANGSYDFEFRLYSAISGGVQAGSTLVRNGVTVSNGAFSVNLDFGANFPGANRYLDVSVKQTGGGSFTPLTPRSQILSTPYAIKSTLADSAATITGPITGANASAMLSVTNTHPGIIDPSPVNLPPAAIKGETTSIVNSTVGVLGISGNGAGVVGVTNSVDDGSAVVGITTSPTGNSVALDGTISSPNGKAVSAEMPGGGTGYLFFGSSGKSSKFTVDAAGNTAVSGALSVFGTISIGDPVTAGTTPVCRDSQSRLANCSSSLRYKTNVSPFRLGTQLIDRLQPITFNWKDDGMHDLGLGAEDVAKIEPLLVTYNAQGDVEGVKYDRIGIVLINAFKETANILEAQIRRNDEQQKQIERQQRDISALKAIVCSRDRRSALCKSK